MNKNDLVVIDDNELGILSTMHKDHTISVDTVAGTRRVPARSVNPSDYMPEEPETVIAWGREALVLDEGREQLLVVYVEGGDFGIVANDDQVARGDDVRRHFMAREKPAIRDLADELTREHVPQPPPRDDGALRDIARGRGHCVPFGPYGAISMGNDPTVTIALADLLDLVANARELAHVQAQMKRVMRVLARAHQDGAVDDHFAWVDEAWS